MVPPEPVTGIEPPDGFDATVVVIVTGTPVLVVPPAIAKEARANPPFVIIVAFNPNATHVVDPMAAEQEMLLPAAIAAAVGVTVTAATSDG